MTSRPTPESKEQIRRDLAAQDLRDSKPHSTLPFDIQRGQIVYDDGGIREATGAEVELWLERERLLEQLEAAQKLALKGQTREAEIMRLQERVEAAERLARGAEDARAIQQAAAERLQEQYEDCREKFLAAPLVANAQRIQELEEQLEAVQRENATLREFWSAHWGVEQGVVDFDLHAEAVSRLEAAQKSVVALLSNPATCPLCKQPYGSKDMRARVCSHGFHAPLVSDPASGPLVSDAMRQDMKPPSVKVSNQDRSSE